MSLSSIKEKETTELDIIYYVSSQSHESQSPLTSNTIVYVFSRDK